MELDEATNIITCLDCGKVWKRSKKEGLPERCDNCRATAYNWKQKNNYLKGNEIKEIHISGLLKQRIIRRKLNPLETYGQIIDRMIENPDIHMTVLYDHTQFRQRTKITISYKAFIKLSKLQAKHNIKSLNEVIWRLISNDSNK